jgi:hypothetical protein
MNWIEKIDSIKAKGAHSQFEEDTIISHIFKHIGTRSKFFVDIGAGAYSNEMSNTRALKNDGWKGVGFDMTPSEDHWIHPVFITPDNVCEKIIGYANTTDIDFLNLDIDSSDYWVLSEILDLFAPTVICTEFNGCLDPDVRKVLSYDKVYTWDGTDKYGYSFSAGKQLLESHDYEIIYNLHDTNIFAIKKEFVQGFTFKPVTAKRNQYHPHNPNAVWITFPSGN